MLNPRQILAFAPWQDVRFGSKADMCGAQDHVRFTPNSDIDCVFRHVRFGPIADTCSAAKEFLFDHLVRAGEQRWRHGEVKGFCGLEIDHQLELERVTIADTVDGSTLFAQGQCALLRI